MPRRVLDEAIATAGIDPFIGRDLLAHQAAEEPAFRRAIDFATTFKLEEIVTLEPRVSTALPAHSHYLYSLNSFNKITAPLLHRRVHPSTRSFIRAAGLVLAVHDTIEDLAKKKRDEELSVIEAEIMHEYANPQAAKKAYEEAEEKYMRTRWPQLRAEFVEQGSNEFIEGLEDALGGPLDEHFKLHGVRSVRRVIKSAIDYFTPGRRTASKFSGSYTDMLRVGMQPPEDAEDFYATLVFIAGKAAGDRIQNDDETNPSTKKVRQLLMQKKLEENMQALLDASPNERVFNRLHSKLSTEFYDAVENAHKSRGLRMMSALKQMLNDYKTFMVVKQSLNYLAGIEENHAHFARNGYIRDIHVVTTCLQHLAERGAKHALTHTYQFMCYGIRKDNDHIILPVRKEVMRLPYRLQEVEEYAKTPEAQTLQSGPTKGRFGKYGGTVNRANLLEMGDEESVNKFQYKPAWLTLFTTAFSTFNRITAADLVAYNQILAQLPDTVKPMANISDIWHVRGQVNRL